jgi:pSer/pThr/pTyr-binding forkhead associated (FHA) protein
VRIEPSTRAVSGHVNCHVEVVPGPPVVWARLKANGESLEIGRNRASIGRASDADVVVPHDDVSRRHALIYRERGQTWLRDLSSANGTFVDGNRVEGKAVIVQPGSMVGLSERRYRFREV